MKETTNLEIKWWLCELEQFLKKQLEDFKDYPTIHKLDKEKLKELQEDIENVKNGRITILH